MKTASVVLSVLFVTPCLTFASVGFASGGPRQVDNSVSQQVFAALTSVGAQIDCGMGKCGTSASNVSCTLKWNGNGTFFNLVIWIFKTRTKHKFLCI